MSADCPKCNGTGEARVKTDPLTGRGCADDCSLCDGTGDL